MKRVCVFCGSNMGRRAAYRQAAVKIGYLLAESGIGLVYGGAKVGLMGTIADAVLEKGGYVTGIIPEALVQRELAHQGLQDLRVVRSMHERKALMADLSDGFIALPGGFGTFEEFCEVLTWSVLGIQQKPCGLLNVENYYQPLLSLFDHAVQEGFLMPENRKLVLAHEEPKGLLDSLLAFRPKIREPEIDRSMR
ncbi:MAG TPA: TIGR00730 family Rossman fold protein [Terriglobales bacterium]|nr:TIGR00730 family Rossman fold protein [Terriglobales bacterium]